MELLRRLSTKPVGLDEEQLRQLASQHRKSSIAVANYDEEPILPSAIKPSIEIFPRSSSTRQEALLISPDATAKGYVITFARTGKHFLTVATSSTSMPGPSHTKHFYGVLGSMGRNRKNSKSNTEGDVSSKLCTLTRDTMSFRKRHHVDDPRNSRRLLEMEFSTSSWDNNALKASIELLNKYSQGSPMEPVRLRWRGRKAGLEGVLECNNKPAAVCAKGHEVEQGQYALYVAPGMDIYICSIIVMAVDDRVRRGSDDSGRNMSLETQRRESEVVQ